MQGNPSGFCQCGCGEQTRLAPYTATSRGWVRGQPLRFIRWHHNGVIKPRPRALKPLVERYDVDPVTGCWVWNGGLRNGYGCIGDGYAHRVVYEDAKGPIPEGLHLDHLCRNKPCVNPDHLEPVTNAENSRRGLRAKLTAERAAEIRASSDSLAILAARYGVHNSVISRVRTGEAWAER